MFNNFIHKFVSFMRQLGGKNMLQSDRPEKTMRFACWVIKVTCTHSDCVTLIAFPREQWLCERPSTLGPYLHCLSCISRPIFRSVSTELPCCFRASTNFSSGSKVTAPPIWHSMLIFGQFHYSLPHEQCHYIRVLRMNVNPLKTKRRLLY